MKKHLILLSTLTLSLALVACGNEKENSNSTSQNITSSSISSSSSTSSSSASSSSTSSSSTSTESSSSNTSTSTETSSSSNSSESSSSSSSTEVVDPSVPDSPVYEDSIELYKASVEKMSTTNYQVNGFGISTNNMSGDPLFIYEKLQHKPDELYFEKISNGKPVLSFIGVSFARKAYIKGDIGRRQDAKITKPWSTSLDEASARETYPVVNNYEDAYDKAPAEIIKDFGKTSSYVNFNIDFDTVSEDNLTYQTLEDGYQLDFNLKIDNGIDSKSVQGYKNQVMTMSDKELTAIDSITISIKLNNDLTVKSYTSEEKYTVKTMSTKVSNKLEYTFNYDEFTITSF